MATEAPRLVGRAVDAGRPDAGHEVWAWVPGELRLGINNYNGTTGGPWSVELRGWSYSDDPQAALP